LSSLQVPGSADYAPLPHAISSFINQQNSLHTSLLMEKDSDFAWACHSEVGSAVVVEIRYGDRQSNVFGEAQLWPKSPVAVAEQYRNVIKRFVGGDNISEAISIQIGEWFGNLKHLFFWSSYIPDQRTVNFISV
jgi:hypothetical protein